MALSPCSVLGLSTSCNSDLQHQQQDIQHIATCHSTGHSTTMTMLVSWHCSRTGVLSLSIRVCGVVSVCLSFNMHAQLLFSRTFQEPVNHNMVIMNTITSIKQLWRHTRCCRHNAGNEPTQTLKTDAHTWLLAKHMRTGDKDSIAMELGLLENIIFKGICIIGACRYPGLVIASRQGHFPGNNCHLSVYFSYSGTFCQ